MYVYEERTGTLKSSALPVRDTYVVAGGHEGPRCVLYEPLTPAQQSRIGVVVIHSDQDYSAFPIAGELALRGYRVLAGQVSDPGATLDRKMLDIRRAVALLKAVDGVEKIVLLGHSGGATLMTAYQAAAEKGVGVWQTDAMLYPSALTEELIPADAMLLLDSNFGNGAMTLFSVDPAVVGEGNGVRLDPALDVFNPQNGFDPESPGYSETFLNTFFAAQRERSNAIIRRALDRLTLIRQGRGNYLDDEPFLVTGAAQFMTCNKLIPQDTRLLAHTKRAYPLLRAGGVTTEVIRCVRRPRGGENPTPRLDAAVIGTVRSYLSNRAVLAGADYRIGPDGVTGVLWDGANTCPPGNVRQISVPMLIMGMTGSYEYLAAEAIYENAASADKTILFVEGAGHNFDAAGRADEFGDTARRVYDACDRWMRDEGRLL